LAAGFLSKDFGPAFGGLFLAFPAIFPASATLVEKHERNKSQDAGLSGTNRASKAAAADAAGAAIGSMGLVGFAIVVWKLLPIVNAGVVLLAATAACLVIAVLIWRIRSAAQDVRLFSRHEPKPGH
jgi:hypothetical protein